MSEELKPIVFMNGDETTRIVADMVRNGIFKDFPTIDADLGHESRLSTKDAIIKEAAKNLAEVGAGVKISTASNHPDIKAAGLKSANIELRPAAGGYATVRMTQAAGTYPKPVVVVRYLKGGFYDESAFKVNKKGIGKLVQRVDFSNLPDMAKLASRVAKENNLELYISSKWTISPSEKAFIDGVTKVWDAEGIKYERELTDIAIARIPSDQNRLEGGWLHVFDNPNGDTASDVADLKHGNHVMGSAINCIKDGKEYVYEELPGGTAPDKMETDLKGSNFFNPLSIIFAFAGMFEVVNPQKKEWFDKVRAETLNYLQNTKPEDCGCEDMVKFIANAAG